MDIRTSAQGGAVELALSGRLDSDSATALEAAIAAAWNGTATGLRLHMAQIDYISSAGVRELVRAHKLAGGKVAVVAASSRVRSVLTVAGLAFLLAD